jgi:hypothetical protein
VRFYLQVLVILDWISQVMSMIGVSDPKFNGISRRVQILDRAESGCLAVVVVEQSPNLLTSAYAIDACIGVGHGWLD